MSSRACRRRSASSRRPPATTRARPSAPSPRSTTTCACSTRAPARRICPDHGLPLRAQSVSQMVDAVLALPEDTRLMVLAPVVRDRKGEFADLLADMQARGYVRFRIGATASRARSFEAGCAASAEEDREARYRRRRRPPARPARREAAPGRELRGRAAHRRRPRHRAADGRRRRRRSAARAPVQQQIRLPGVQLCAVGAGAAAVLVQLAGGRLPHLRRPGPGDGVRRPSAWWPSRR